MQNIISDINISRRKPCSENTVSTLFKNTLSNIYIFICNLLYLDQYKLKICNLRNKLCN